jgi:hypothetical protein
LNDWTTFYDNKEATEVVYTDFSKAFDRVSHAKLAEVLSSFGIIGANLCWITDFLTGRTQSVEIDGVRSPTLNVLSDVPQGSVLGPLLFVLFIEDIQNCCQKDCKIGLYADDSKIFSTKPRFLQNTLANLDTFIESRQLRLATDKCQHLTISSRDTDERFYLGGHCISKSFAVTDLGIRITSDLKWSQHISIIRSKGCARCYQILRSFRSKNIWTYVKAYTIYVRPTLETNTVIWSPHYKEDVIDVESVQRRYIKAICRRCNIHLRSYAERLQALDMETLEYRRYKSDVIYVYKMMHGLVDLQFSDFFTVYSTPYNLRRHKYCLKGFKSNVDVRKYFFSNRVINIWNNLPEPVVAAMTIDTFRKRLNTFDLRSVQKMVF